MKLRNEIAVRPLCRHGLEILVENGKLGRRFRPEALQGAKGPDRTGRCSKKSSIANRVEIACRLAGRPRASAIRPRWRSIRRFDPPGPLHVRLSPTKPVCPIGPAGPPPRPPKNLPEHPCDHRSAAENHGADAIHPGYGVSVRKRQQFCRSLCAKSAGLTFNWAPPPRPWNEVGVNKVRPPAASQVPSVSARRSCPRVPRSLRDVGARDRREQADRFSHQP